MKPEGAIWADNTYVYPAGSSQSNCTGGWEAVMDAEGASDWSVPVGSPTPYKLMGYGWFTNYRWPGSSTTTMNPFLVGESPWPDNQEQCTAQAAMVSHIAASFSPDTIHWSFLHGGFGQTDPGASSDRLLEYFDNPVGYGDGHVTFHSEDEVQARASTGSSWAGGIFYWY